MSDAEQFLEAARKSFGLASSSTESEAVAHYAEMGRDFLTRAHNAAALTLSPESPSCNGAIFIATAMISPPGIGLAVQAEDN